MKSIQHKLCSTNTCSWSERDERAERATNTVCSLPDLKSSFQLQTSLVVCYPDVNVNITVAVFKQSEVFLKILLLKNCKYCCKLPINLTLKITPFTLCYRN